MAGTVVSSDSNGIRVKRRCGASTDDGVNYENYMFLYVLLTLIEDDNIEEFYIAQNVNNVCAFDDLVFKIRFKCYNSNESMFKIFLVQMKHIASRVVSMDSLTGTTGNGPFKLLKYYKCYKFLQENIGKFHDGVLDECQLQDMVFVIYTNATCPLGDNNNPDNSIHRQILETGEEGSNVFSFSSSATYDLFHQELKKNKNPISQEEDGAVFLQQLVFFAGQSNTVSMKNNLIKKLGHYFSKLNCIDYVLQRALKFIAENNWMWMSQHSGVLFDITINYQGFLIRLNDMRKFWKNEEIFTKIVVRQICNGNIKKYVRIGKLVKSPDPLYIERIVIEDDDDVYLPLRSCMSKKSRDVSLYRAEITRCRREILRQQFVILTAGFGMGKSSFLIRHAYLIKKRHPEKYVIIANLVDFSSYLDQIDEKEDNKTSAEKFLVKIAGILPGSISFDVFQWSLRAAGMMVIFLHGVDEISQLYYQKVCMIIQTIRKEFQVQLFVTTRPILKRDLKMYFDTSCWDLLEFTTEDIKTYIRNHCNIQLLDAAARDILGIPIFCKLMSDIIKNDKETNSNDITNKVNLYDKFIEVMYEIHHEKKDKVNLKIPTINSKMRELKKIKMEQYEMVALLEVFDKWMLLDLNWNIENRCKKFLDEISQVTENFGLISDVVDGRPSFLHQNIAEYLSGRWFARNPDKYKEYIAKYRSFPKEVDFFMSSKLTNSDPIFKTILISNKDFNPGDIKDLSILDEFGRNLLHYVNLSNNVIALKYILFNGFTLTEEISSVTDFNDLELELIFKKNLILNWLSFNLKKNPQLGPLIGTILFGVEFRDCIPHFLLQHSKSSPFHAAILNRKRQTFDKLIKDHLDSQNDLGLTPLHIAVWMEDVDTVKLLGEKGAKYSRKNILGVYPHQVLQNYSNMNDMIDQIMLFYKSYFRTKSLKAEILAENFVDQNLPLHDAAQRRGLDEYLVKHYEANVFRRVIQKIQINADFQVISSRGHTALHVAAASNSLGQVTLRYLKSFKYKKDFDGYYPHDYMKDHQLRSVLQNLAIKSGIRKLAVKERKVFGKDVKDLINKVELGALLLRRVDPFCLPHFHK